MNISERQQIVSYLCGPREYSEGVALYQKYGPNLRLKKTFATDSTQTTREILLEELRKLAGLTEAEFAQLPRKAARHERDVVARDIPCTAEVAVGLEESRSQYARAPEPVKKMIRFREKYPFLSSPDCPDALKVLVADMITAYYKYKEAHGRLQSFPDEEASATVSECETVIEEYLRNREISEELEYYREHGTILGKASCLREREAVEDLGNLSEIDLMKQLNSAAANESKQRRAVSVARERGEANERAEAALSRWSARKAALQQEVARRKKK